MARRLCSLLAGTISLHSILGEGTTATIRVPRHLAAARRSALRVPRVAVITPCSKTTEQVFGALQSQGARGRRLPLDEATLTSVRREAPDLLILDLQITGDAGWNWLTHLTVDPTTANVPVLALVAPGEGGAARALGAVAYVERPLTPTTLERALAHCARSARSQRSILVVEDDEPTRALVCRILQREGFTVREAADGTAGLQVLEQHPVDLVVLDLMMPGLGGFELLREIRSRPRWHTLPVLVSTAKALTDAEQQELASAANGLIPKAGDTRLALLRGIEQLQHLVQ